MSEIIFENFKNGAPTDVNILCQKNSYALFLKAIQDIDHKPDHIYSFIDKDGEQIYQLIWHDLIWNHTQDDAVSTIMEVINKIEAGEHEGEFLENSQYGYAILTNNEITGICCQSSDYWDSGFDIGFDIQTEIKNVTINLIKDNGFHGINHITVGGKKEFNRI